MSTEEWADYQRQVWRERQQKRRARQAAQEEEAAEEVGTEDDAEEEVSSDVPLASSQAEKYIYSLDGNDVKKKLAAWHNQFSNEELQLSDCFECKTKFSDDGTELASILGNVVSTLLPGFLVLHIHAKLSSMKEPAYFEPQKSSS